MAAWSVPLASLLLAIPQPAPQSCTLHVFTPPPPFPRAVQLRFAWLGYTCVQTIRSICAGEAFMWDSLVTDDRGSSPKASRT